MQDMHFTDIILLTVDGFIAPLLSLSDLYVQSMAPAKKSIFSIRGELLIRFIISASTLCSMF